MAFTVSYIYEIVDRYSTKMKRISNATADVSKSINKAAKDAEKLGKKMKSLGRGMAISVTAPLALFAKSSVNASISMDAMNNRLSASIGSFADVGAKMGHLTDEG